MRSVGGEIGPAALPGWRQGHNGNRVNLFRGVHFLFLFALIQTYRSVLLFPMKSALSLIEGTAYSSIHTVELRNFTLHYFEK